MLVQEAAALPSELSGELEVVTPEESEDERGAEEEVVEDANLPGSHPALRQRNIEFSKSGEQELSSPIERVWYINPYGQEIRPPANPKVIAAIEQAEAVIYSIGSLYTRYIHSLRSVQLSYL